MNQFNKRVKTGSGNIFNVNRSNGDINIPIANDLDTADLDVALGASQGIVLRNITENLQIEIAAIDSDVSSFDGRLTTAEGQIVVLEGDVSTLQGQVSSLDTRTTNLESSVMSINSSVTALGSRMTTAESAISTIDSEITTLDSDLTSLQGLVATQGTEITTNASDIFFVDNRVDTVVANLAALDGRVTTVEGTVSSQGTAITDIDSIVTNGTTGNAALGTRMTSAESAIASLESGSYALDAGTNISVTGTSTKTVNVVDNPTFSGVVTCEGLVTADSRLTIEASTSGSDVDYISSGAHRFKTAGLGVDACAIGDETFYAKTIRAYGTETVILDRCNIEFPVVSSTGLGYVGSLGVLYNSVTNHTGTDVEQLSPPCVFAIIEVGLVSGVPTANFLAKSTNLVPGLTAAADSVRLDLASSLFVHSYSGGMGIQGFGYCPLVNILSMAPGTQSNIRIYNAGNQNTTNFFFYPNIDGLNCNWSDVTSGLLRLQIIFFPTLF